MYNLFLTNTIPIRGLLAALPSLTPSVIDTLWILVCSGLVFLMQPGFMCLESGLTRSKNSINVAVKNLADFSISVALFWSTGYAIMFGTTWGGWLGHSGFWFNLHEHPQAAAFFIFQVMFCSTATTIVSGAVAERLKFSSYLVLATLASGLVYPFFGHWAWNGLAIGQSLGWLGQMGFVDFAGSTVVHSIGAWIALAVLKVVGSRLGRFPVGRPAQLIPGSNLPLSALGVMLLWLGWFGFNGGSVLGLTEDVPLIIVNTVLAGVGGMLCSGALDLQRNHLPRAESLMNGSLAGLVAITAGCHAVNTPLAFVVGATGAAVMQLWIYWLDRRHIDDAVNAIAVHGGAGIWGTLAVGFFGNLELLGTGLGRWQQIAVQLLGCGVACVWAYGLTFILVRSLNQWRPLRVSPANECKGLNWSEHGAKTELYDLYQVMDYQARTQDLSVRVPVEPFTEAGHIAYRYNQVMDAMEAAVIRHQAIVSKSMDAILTFDLNTFQIMSANPRAEVLFGYPATELLTLSIHHLLGWSVQTISERSKLLKSLIREKPQEIIAHRRDGSVFPVEVILSRIELEHRTFLTGTFRDITERKQAQEAKQRQHENEVLQRTLDELRAAQTQLIQSEKMSSLGQMVAGVAHEINNPVNFIAGNLTYAQNYTTDLLDIVELYQQVFPDVPEEIQEALEDKEFEYLREDFPKLHDSLRIGTERIQEIVHSLRIFSRLDEAEVKRVNLHEGIDSTLMILRNRLKANLPGLSGPIEIIRSYGEIPIIECFAGQLNQVFMNLFSNAIDAIEEAWNSNHYSPEIYPAIAIATEVIPQDWIRITISDNGMGIAPEVHSKLFDPFFTTKEVGKGTGLGLSISYQVVVDRHQGRMHCQTAASGGAEFIVEIPIFQPEEPSFFQKNDEVNY